MSYEVSGLLQEDGLLRIAIRGVQDSRRTVELIQQIIELARQPGVRYVLVDVRELQGRASLGESYFNIRNIPADSPRYRTAVLELEQYIDNGVFYDTAAGNMGYFVKHFLLESEALQWLMLEAATADATPAADASATTIR